MVQLRHTLQRLRKERYLRYSQREWITSLVTQICMAIGNRDRYRAANEDMMRLLEYLRDLDLPENTGEQRSTNAYDDITALWRRVFGDPVEWERKHAERNALGGLGESAEAKLIRERMEFVQRNFLR
jgi:hypothetical protein